MNVGVEHHLIDVARRNRLLVDDCADIQTLSHAHVVDVLYHSHRLAHTHALRRKAGEDISLGVARESHERLRVLDAFLDEQREVASVAVDDECLLVLEKGVERSHRCSSVSIIFTSMYEGMVFTVRTAVAPPPIIITFFTST